MQRIIATPLASRFCAPRQRSAQSPPDARSPLCSVLLHSDARSPFRSALLHSGVRLPLRPALLFAAPTCRRPTHTRRRVLFCISRALPPHSLRRSAFWKRFHLLAKNAGGCPRLFPNCLETFPFFYYSILPLFDFVNPFFSFFSLLFTQDCILSPFRCNFRLLYTRQVFFFAQQPSHFTQAAIPKDCPSKAACEVGSPHKQRARSTRCPAITSKRLSTRRLPHLRLPYMCLIKTNDSKLLLIG